MEKEIIGLVSVRTASSRLKNKAFCEILGKPVIEILIERLKATPFLDDFIICTTILRSDDVIERFCIEKKVKFFRGEEKNVLKRFVDASRLYPSRWVARITGDNPLTDFENMRKCFQYLKNLGADYSRPLGVPAGTAAEIIKSEKLYELLEKSTAPELSEYMTYFFEAAPFIKTSLYKVDEDVYMPDLKLTIDYEDDLIFIENLIKGFNGRIPSLPAIIAHCRKLKDYPRFIEDSNRVREIKKHIRFE